MNRRRFLTNTGLLLSAYGFSSAFKMDLLEKLGHSFLPQAHAENPAPRRILEICLRSGVPTMMIGTGSEFNQLSQPRYSNFAYAGNQILKASGTDNLYLNIDSQSLAPHAQNIAITQGVRSEGGHTEMFNLREGGAGKRRTTPIVEMANLNPTASMLHGVQWIRNTNRPEIRNMTNEHTDLVKTNPTSFVGLFKQSRLQLTGEELQKVMRAAERLSRRQASYLETQMKNSHDNLNTYNKSLAMMSADFGALLKTDSMDNRFAKNRSYGYTREAIAYTLKAFEHNLLNSSAVTLLAGDRHGAQQPGDNASLIQGFSEILTATIEHLKKTPDLAAGTGKTLWDTTTIVVTSEFTRGVSPFGRDNSDGNTQGFMLIGKHIKGNYYGGFTLQDSSSSSNAPSHGFDLLTGATTMGEKNTTEQAYYTIKKAVGLAVGPADELKVMKAMITS